MKKDLYLAIKTATSAFQRLVWRARSVPTTTTLVVKAGIALQQLS